MADIWTGILDSQHIAHALNNSFVTTIKDKWEVYRE